MSSTSNNVTSEENPPICFCTRIIKNFTETRTMRMKLRKSNQRSGKFCILNTPSELTSSERCAPDVTVCPPTNFLGEISSTIISYVVDLLEYFLRHHALLIRTIGNEAISS